MEILGHIFITLGVLFFVLSIVKLFAKVVPPPNFLYARFRIEWESNVVTYKVLPYLPPRVPVDLIMSVLSNAKYREQTEVGQKTLVQDTVKTVTLVHENWPQPSVDDKYDTTNN